MLPIPSCDPGPGLVPAQTNCPYRPLLSLGFVQVVSHLPPPLNCYAGSSLPSSWLPPVRGAHRGKDVQYFVLYSAHRGVPVQHRGVSQRALSMTSSCIYWKERSYQIASHMLERYQIELAAAKQVAHTRRYPAILDPMQQNLPIVDNIRMLQEHVPRSALFQGAHLAVEGKHRDVP